MRTEREGIVERVEFLGVEFDPIDSDALVAQLGEVSARSAYGYLVTPNVDHIVRMTRSRRPADRALHGLYQRARWCVCDSRILSRLGRLCSRRLPVVPGSDLTERVLREVLRPGDTVALVGGGAHTVSRLSARYPRIRFLQHVPPMGLLADPAALGEAAGFVGRSGARFTLVAVGAPQQELIASAAADVPGAGGLALCVGASIDFLTGDQRRAPRWVQSIGMEWAHRLASDPARLWRRYLIEGPKIFLEVVRWRRSVRVRDGERG